MAQEIAKGRDLLREFLHGDGHIGHEVVVLIGDRGPVRSRDDDALLLHDLQGVSYAVLRDAGHLSGASRSGTAAERLFETIYQIHYDSARVPNERQE